MKTIILHKLYFFLSASFLYCIKNSKKLRNREHKVRQVLLYLLSYFVRLFVDRQDVGHLTKEDDWKVDR